MQAIQTWKENIQSRDSLGQVTLHILYWPPKHSTDEDKLVEKKSTKKQQQTNKQKTTNEQSWYTNVCSSCLSSCPQEELKSGMELNHNDLWESFII